MTPAERSSTDGELYASVAELRSDVNNLTQAVRDFVNSTDQRFARQDQQFAKLQDGRGVNWSGVMAGLALATILGGLLGSWYARLDRDLQNHMQLDGHPQAMIQHAITETKLGALSYEVERLRDHMQGVDQTRWTQSDGLETRDRIAELEKDVATLQGRNE